MPWVREEGAGGGLDQVEAEGVRSERAGGRPIAKPTVPATMAQGPISAGSLTRPTQRAPVSGRPVSAMRSHAHEAAYAMTAKGPNSNGTPDVR